MNSVICRKRNFHFHLSFIGCQLLVVSCQLLVVSCQLLVVSC
ncbi:MAG: hypothetical protein ACKO99_22435 [Dolichospermum sp.]